MMKGKKICPHFDHEECVASYLENVPDGQGGCFARHPGLSAKKSVDCGLAKGLGGKDLVDVEEYWRKYDEAIHL